MVVSRRKQLKTAQNRWKWFWLRSQAGRPGRKRNIEGFVPPQGQCPLSRYNAKAEVYVCEHLGRHKIGVSFNSKGRMYTICPDDAVTPILLATIVCATRDLAEAIEKHLHWLLRPYRWDGEWFALPTDMVVRLKRSQLSPDRTTVAVFGVFDDDTVAALRKLFGCGSD